jgi:hypothetical protein
MFLFQALELFSEPRDFFFWAPGIFFQSLSSFGGDPEILQALAAVDILFLQSGYFFFQSDIFFFCSSDIFFQQLQDFFSGSGIVSWALGIFSGLQGFFFSEPSRSSSRLWQCCGTAFRALGFFFFSQGTGSRDFSSDSEIIATFFLPGTAELFFS